MRGFMSRLLVILFTTEGKKNTEEEIKVKGFHQYKLFFSVYSVVQNGFVDGCLCRANVAATLCRVKDNKFIHKEVKRALRLRGRHK